MGTISTPLGVPLTSHKVMGPKRAVHTLISGSATYATGGETLTPSVFGLSQIDNVYMLCGREAEDLAAQNAGFSVRLAGTPKAPLLKFYTGAAEVANGTSVARNFGAVIVGT